MMMIHLSVELKTGFRACYGHSLGIDNHDIIAHLYTRRERGLVFAQQHVSYTRCEPAEVLPVGISHEPLALNLACFRVIRLIHFRSPFYPGCRLANSLPSAAPLNNLLRPGSIRVQAPGLRVSDFSIVAFLARWTQALRNICLALRPPGHRPVYAPSDIRTHLR